ncbi:hypothetical protein [Streptomyces nojiriensis]|uniref:hypothetical protein n=1 Tax=Streptomyces nojiriensis TaxID=66374 RepID=UPI0035DE510B
MADQVKQEDDQNLWRARYTAEEGWGPGVVFADHLSVAAPALAVVDGTLYCAHRGARREGKQQLPLRWTSFTPAAAQPFVAALEKASKALPEGATEEQAEQRKKGIKAAAEALEQARKWRRDAYALTTESHLGGFVDEMSEESLDYLDRGNVLRSAETPALVDDNGTLRMVFTSSGGDDDADYSKLFETHLATKDGEPAWAVPTPLRLGVRSPVAPALVVFNGAVHLVCVDLGSVGGLGGEEGEGSQGIVHFVRGADGKWVQAAGADGTKIPTPGISAKYFAHEDWEARHEGTGRGYPGNLALAVHDGALHLVYRINPLGGDLLHASFDGTAWSQPGVVGDGKNPDARVRSRRSAALASYDGKLHAVYPHLSIDKLCHTTWTKDGGWTEPAELEGHDSRNTPALLVYREGPAGAERETLLLVHRGVDRYVPPAPPTPPAPPSLAEVKERGETVTGESVTDYGAGAWSRVTHQVSYTPATLNDGTTSIIATWQAKAEYYWGFSWYPENYDKVWRPRMKSGTLWLQKGRGVGSPRAVNFSGNFDSDGHFRHDQVIPDVKPGTYELYVSSSNTEKDHGYWHAHRDMRDTGDHDLWTRIDDMSDASVTVTIEP